MFLQLYIHVFFFFNDTATTEIYTLSLHDALPICITFRPAGQQRDVHAPFCQVLKESDAAITKNLQPKDRKSTRLNSSHSQISYAVFCLKKKKNNKYANTSTVLPITLSLNASVSIR